MSRLRVRVDDFLWTKPEERYRHNLDSYRRFHDVLSRHFPDYLLGVIPSNVTEDDLRWIGENGVRFALHGVRHDERFPNEFRDHETQAEVEAKLASSLDHLQSFCKHEIDTYIPPHNVIDAKTCRALDSVGFVRILGGPGTDPAMAQYTKAFGLDLVLSNPPYEYGRSDELLERGSTQYINQRLADDHDVWLTLHWTWETNIGLEHLGRYLGQLVRDCGIMGSNG